MQATFTQGSIFRHISVMTFTSAIGLFSLFLVDLVDVYWLSKLGELEIAAAIGYAGSILFFTLSFSIGLSIASGALVSQCVGAGNTQNTLRVVSHILVTIFTLTSILGIAVYFYIDFFLQQLGAEGRAFELAHAYLAIIIPSFPCLSLAMACSGILRALGDAKNAMYLTLLGGIINAIFDPLLIFTAGLGIEGAAWSSVLARAGMIIFGLSMVGYKYGLLRWPTFENFSRDAKDYLGTAIPAVLTNLSTPIGVAFTTGVMASYGDNAVAGNAIISKLHPLVFTGLFALSGAVGPIAGQNFGAKQFTRVYEVMKSSLLFTLGYTLAVCAILAVFAQPLVTMFHAQGDAADMILWFCYGVCLFSFFHGVTFFTNALFNNLRMAHLATMFNFAKATLFTMPFVILGGKLAGPVGILVATGIGATIIAVIGYAVAHKKIKSLALNSSVP